MRQGQSLCGCARNIRAEFSVNDENRLLGRLGTELVVVGDRAILLRCELSLYVTEPAHPQGNDAVSDLVDVLGSVFFQCFGRFHFEHDDLNLIAAAASLSQPAGKKEKPQRGWGA